MRLFLLATLVMIAFAANSVLIRLALAGGEIGALPFATLRIASGGAVLALLVLVRRRALPLRASGRWTGVLSLTLYVIAFSLAYLGLDAGTGALILFGCVQITMFSATVIERQPIPPLRWLGAMTAFGGLAWLLWPRGADALSPLHAGLMAAAGLGWGLYSLAGRRAGPPLPATAANFVLAAPLCLLLLVLSLAAAPAVPMTAAGVGLALASGIVTSGLGYALWYAVLPQIPATVAALAQLSVPVIAMAGGMAFLGEAPSLRFAGATVLVLGGIATGLLARRG
ncbi:DMT family transporter [Tropicimonas sp. IMCC34043]|uniref:DMT family transporter n=1 Tax=Tropicimonas sp. IMCC34043 TaxID=2248760 RepID=UPI000E241DE7|nr:DMT family transporter [Tropicimonas sp. IMCC34043]